MTLCIANVTIARHSIFNNMFEEEGSSSAVNLILKPRLVMRPNVRRKFEYKV